MLDTMKGKIVIYVGLLLGLVACSDTAAVRSVEGAYRYKTTGQVTIEENYDGATKADTMLIALSNESGTLEMVSLHKGDSMLLTIDPLNGQLAVTRGLVNGARFDFEPYKRTLEVGVPKGLLDSLIHIEKQEVFDITVSGYAEVYDNNLVFRLQYQGASETTERTLRGSNIMTLAKKN
jgi:hypothetical protein